MIGSDAIGLVFRLKAENDASDEVKKFRKDVDDLNKAADDSAQNGLVDFAQSLGLSAEKTALLSSALPVAGTALAGLATAAIGAGVAVLGIGAALFQLSQNAAEAGTEIKNLQNLTGLTAESISTIKTASEAAGTSIDEFEEIWESFIEVLIEGGQGAEDAAEKLKKAGIEPQKGFKDLEGSVQKAFDAIRNANSQAEKSAIAMAVFGESGLNMVKVAGEMTGGFEAFRKKLIETGVAFDDEGTRKAKEYDAQMKQLGMQFEGVKRAIGQEFMPVFLDMAKVTTDFFEKNPGAVRNWAKNVTDSLYGLVDVWEELAEARNKYITPDYLEKLKQIDEYIFGKDLAEANRRNPLASNPLQNAGNDIAERIRRRGERRRQLTTSSIDLNDSAFDFDKDAAINDQKKRDEEAEKRRKEREAITKRNNAADLQLLKNQLAAVEKAYADTFKASSEAFKETGNLQAFLAANGKMSKAFSDELAVLLPQIEAIENKAAKAAKATDSELKLLNAEQQKRVDALNAKAKETSDAADKVILERQKKQTAETIKNKQAEIQAEVALKEAANRTLAARDASSRSIGLISEDDAIKFRQKREDDFLKFKESKLREELALVKGNKDEEARINRELATLKYEIEEQDHRQTEELANRKKKSLEEQKKYELELAAIRREVLETEREITNFRKEQERKVLSNTFENSYGKDRIAALEKLVNFDLLEEERRQQIRIDDLGAERKASIERLTIEEIELGKREELNKLYRERELLSEAEFHARKAKIEADAEAAKRTEMAENTTGGFFAGALESIVGGGVDPLNKITDQAEYMKAVYSDLAAMSQQAIGSMIQGLGQLAAQWLSTGKFSAKAALQMVSGVAAGLAIEAGLKALMEYAEGAAMAANPFTAWLAPGHFAAAKAYGVAAAAAGAFAFGTGLGARALGGGESFRSASSAAVGIGGASNGSNDEPGRRSGAPEPGVFTSKKEEQIVELARNTPVNQTHNWNLQVIQETDFGNFFRYEVKKGGVLRNTLLEEK